jgi:uncharacterized protein involved in exopolysaccharide biosynthesis
MDKEGAPVLKANAAGDDSVDVVGVLAILWFHRKPMAYWVLFVTLLGVAYALLAKPVYESQATIAQREADDGRGMARFFSQLGGGVGAIAAQFGGGGGDLEKTSLILKSNDLAEAVITRHNLLPVLYPKAWDSARHKWKQKNPRKQPTLRKGAKLLRERYLQVTVDAKKGVLVIKLTASKDTLARQMVEYYLEALNDRVREDVLKGAGKDREYLEEQLGTISDPYLREKLQDLIAAQIEKSMLVRTEAFDVIERPLVPLLKSSPKRTRVVAIAFLFGVMTACAGVFAGRGWRNLKRSVSDRLLQPAQ